MKLPTLHRGPWIYQSPRITMILAYLYSKTKDQQIIANIIKEHIQYVLKLSSSEEKSWIVKRLEGLGYERKRPWAKEVERLVDPNIAAYYFEKLGLQGNKLKMLIEFIEQLLRILRARDTLRAVAYLPPMLTLPEKVLLLNCLSSSKYFDLKTSLKVVILSWIKETDPLELLEGEINQKRKQFRFRYTYLTSLNIVTGKRSRPRPTLIGFILTYVVENNINNVIDTYVRALIDYRKLIPMLLLDIFSLDIAIKDMLESYINLVSKILSNIKQNIIKSKEILAMLHEEVAYLPLDVRGLTAVTILKHINTVLRLIET
ncbi:hypothetical protein PYJP_11050 [Pyrofollis japonicus]|uniref:hypothetical protein n=1 Tax=Pyrofollis japonicus TaxID=3060460 RepID=UPI00295B3845|nr:hypothetical protein [Pyrofollis japonicus]BEP17753.1 hypothetical protein PYJP_11050 [Pyrofollis japonicus]